MPITSRATVVAPGDRFEQWHGFTCRSYSMTECNGIPDRHFSAQVSLGACGPLTVSNIWSRVSSGEPIRVRRRPADIRQDGRDDFMIWLALQGDTGFAQHGRAVRMRCGDMLLHDQAQPFDLQFGRYAEAMMITVPRPLLLARLPQAAALVARPVTGSSRLGTLATDIMRDLLRLIDGVETETARRVGMAALDMLAVALEAELAGPADPASGGARLQRAQRYMLARLGEPGLDVATIARAQNMSPRSLNRMFAQAGETPIRWLWRQRLAACYRALAEGAPGQVTEIALNHGFSDMSHFSRAFKAAYGSSPQAVRRAGRDLPLPAG